MSESFFSTLREYINPEAESARRITQSQEMTAQPDLEYPEGKIPVMFHWRTEPKSSWAGLTKKELTKLVKDAADYNGMNPADYNRMRVHFGDNITFKDAKGATSTKEGICLPSYRTDTGEFVYSDVIINRSLELALEKSEEAQSEDAAAELRAGKPVRGVSLVFKEPWEWATWVIGEEVNHTAVHMRLKTKQNKDAATAKYQEKFNEPGHTGEVLEVAASRQTVRFLRDQAILRGKAARAQELDTLFQQSLHEKIGIELDTSLVYKQAFIPTGYKPAAKM